MKYPLLYWEILFQKRQNFIAILEIKFIAVFSRGVDQATDTSDKEVRRFTLFDLFDA